MVKKTTRQNKMNRRTYYREPGYWIFAAIVAAIALLIGSVSTCSAQRIDTAYHCRDGRVIHPGDTIYLETGTLAQGDFKSIYHVGGVDNMPLESKYSGLYFTVKYFRREGSKNMGYKTLAYVSKDAFTYFAIDIEQGIRTKEIEF